MPPPAIQYRSLCISEISRNATDNALKEEIYKRFDKYGDFFNIKISFFNNQRVVYINFTYDEDARKAFHECHNFHLFGRLVKIEPVPIKNNRRQPQRPDSRSLSPSPFQRRRPDESPNQYAQDLRMAPKPPQYRTERDDFYRDYSPHKETYYREVAGPAKRYMEEGPLYEEDFRAPPIRSSRYREEPFYPLDATRSLFIGNIPDDMDSTKIFKIFKVFGPITDIDVKKSSKGLKTSTYAFVKYFTIDFALKARDEMQGEPIDNIPCKIGFGKPSPTKKLWIGGLGSWTTLGLLEREFDRFGPILKIDYLKGDSFAFILYENIDAAELAYHEMKGAYLMGESAPHTRLMTDFADNKSTFYDGSSVSEFLENYDKPINYLPIIRKLAAAPSNYQVGYNHDNRIDYDRDNNNTGYEHSGRSGQRSNKKHSPHAHHSRYETGGEREEGEMPEEDLLNNMPDGRHKISYGKGNKNQSPSNGNNNIARMGHNRRSVSSNDMGSPKRRRLITGTNERQGKDGNDLALTTNNTKYVTHQESKNPTNKGNSVYSGSTSRSGSSSSINSGSHGSVVNAKHYKKRSHHKMMAPSKDRKSNDVPHGSSNNNNNLITTKRAPSTFSSASFSSDHSQIDDKMCKAVTLDALIGFLGPSVWAGEFTIKNSAFPLILYHLPQGNGHFFRNRVLPSLSLTTDLQIVQRFRLDSTKIDDMAKLINKKANNDIIAEFADIHYSIFLAMDSLTKDSLNNPEIKSSHKRLLKDLIHYLRQKNAAGVIFLDSIKKANNTDSTSNNILYAFPPCDFTRQFFANNYPSLQLPDESVSSTSYLLIVVMKGASKKKH